MSADNCFRLDTGVEALATWSDTAHQAQRNVLYKALFAVTDGTVFRRYPVLQDTATPCQFFVMVRETLVLKISFLDRDRFGIVYIGPLDDAPGLDRSVEAA